MSAVNRLDLRQTLLYGFVIIAAIVVAFSLSKATKLNAQYKADYAAYLNAAKLGPTNPESGRILNDLVQRSPGSFILHWNYGLFLGQTQRPQEGAAHYARALELNPFLSLNGNFLYEYALILHQSGDYARSKQYLALAKQHGVEQRLQENLNSLLQDLTRRGY